MNYKAIIFDMDGTIICTELMWQQATHKILDIYAGHLSAHERKEINTYLKGLAVYESCKYIAQHAKTPVSVDEIRATKSKIAHDLYETQGLNFIPFFPEFHAKTQKYNLKTAIATNAIEQTVEKTLKFLPLRDFFGEHIYNIDMVNKVCKPDPTIFLHAAKNIGVDPQNCIVIEDSVHGIKAAKAAGMYCIAINTGNDRHLLGQADEIVDCYTHINLEKLLYNK